MTDPFTEALDGTEDAQRAYGEQLGFAKGRTPFAAESLPDASIAVRVNQDLLQEVASHILNRAGHISVIDQRGAGKTHFRELVYQSLRDGPRSDEFAIARIKEVESITTRRFYTRLLDELQRYDYLEVPATYPHATDEVRSVSRTSPTSWKTRTGVASSRWTNWRMLPGVRPHSSSYLLDSRAWATSASRTLCFFCSCSGRPELETASMISAKRWRRGW